MKIEGALAISAMQSKKPKPTTEEFFCKDLPSMLGLMENEVLTLLYSLCPSFSFVCS
jgi:hypothetical protein